MHRLLTELLTKLNAHEAPAQSTVQELHEGLNRLLLRLALMRTHEHLYTRWPWLSNPDPAPAAPTSPDPQWQHATNGALQGLRALLEPDPPEPPASCLKESPWSRLLSLYDPLQAHLEQDAPGDFGLFCTSKALQVERLLTKPGDTAQAAAADDQSKLDRQELAFFRRIISQIDAFLESTKDSQTPDAQEDESQCLHLLLPGRFYEDLQSFCVARATEPSLLLKGKNPDRAIALETLERWQAEGTEQLLTQIAGITGRGKALLRKETKQAETWLVQAQETDESPQASSLASLARRAAPFLAWVRRSPGGEPLLLATGHLYLTQDTKRRSTGTHYTPYSLAQELVRETLAPHLAREKAETPTLCDLAMGTGTFLLEALRLQSRPEGKNKTKEAATPDEQACLRRRKACLGTALYGVDLNPTSVELARMVLATFAGCSPSFPPLRRHLRVGDGLHGFVTKAERDRHTRPPSSQEEDAAKPALHWYEHFPSLFGKPAQGGFDAIVANPPYIGGQRITRHYGRTYRDFLVEVIAEGRRGSADLSAYFLLRARQLLKPSGTMGLLLTDTIAQGDTREVGLAALLESQARPSTLYRAETSRSWPGTASVKIVLLWLAACKDEDWNAPVILDGKAVSTIDSYLRATQTQLPSPRRLHANAGISFIGSQLSGEGFKLTPDEAQALLLEAPNLRDVLMPILRGVDITTNPTQDASQWVINFHDRTLEAASQYPEALAIVRARVKPERDRTKRKSRRERWWQFAEKCTRLYETIAPLTQVFVQPFTTKYICPTLVEARQVFSAPMVVFARDDFAFFASLQSTHHDLWVEAFGSTMTKGRRYTPSDCFETFPLPPATSPLSEIGEHYHTFRQTLLLQRQQGLTRLYNAFHDPQQQDQTILQMRTLQRQLDQAVQDAYGWHDIPLEHAFFDTPWGLRYTLPPHTREALHTRLLEQNLQHTE